MNLRAWGHWALSYILLCDRQVGAQELTLSCLGTTDITRPPVFSSSGHAQYILWATDHRRTEIVPDRKKS